jgi:hypothetical protein
MGQQIRDENGRVLGYFLTEAEYTKAEQEIASAWHARQAAIDKLNGAVQKWDEATGMPAPDAIVDAKRMGCEGQAE